MKRMAVNGQSEISKFIEQQPPTECIKKLSELNPSNMDKGIRNIYENRYHETSKAGRGFWKLMLDWQGSVFKLIWVDLLAFLVAYTALGILYWNVFYTSPFSKELFEVICIWSSRFSSKIPVTFMTGFYVANVVSRYWDQFVSLPWPDRMAYKIVSFIPGKDDYSRTLRRTLMRYINLSTLLVFRLVSNKVRTRFPGYTTLVEADLMTPTEAVLLAEIDERTPHETTWAPVLWATSLIERERTAGRLKIEPPVFANLISSFDYLENCNRRIFNHGWVNFPLAYTQVATLVVYAYLFSNLFARQYLDFPDTGSMDKNNLFFPSLNITVAPNGSPYMNHTPAVFFPFFTVVEFIGYLGWIKVAETLLNPWGDDDEDFQVNYLIDRNFQTSYFIVDEAVCELGLPPDPFLANSKAVPAQLPYKENKKSKRAVTKKIGKTVWTKKYSVLQPVLQLRNHFEKPAPDSESQQVVNTSVKELNNEEFLNINEPNHKQSTKPSSSPRVTFRADSYMQSMNHPNQRTLSTETETSLIVESPLEEDKHQDKFKV